jgi:hypothetical protein
MPGGRRRAGIVRDCIGREARATLRRNDANDRDAHPILLHRRSRTARAQSFVRPEPFLTAATWLARPRDGISRRHRQRRHPLARQCHRRCSPRARSDHRQRGDAWGDGHLRSSGAGLGSSLRAPFTLDLLPTPDCGQAATQALFNLLPQLVQLRSAQQVYFVSRTHLTHLAFPQKILKHQPATDRLP